MLLNREYYTPGTTANHLAGRAFHKVLSGINQYPIYEDVSMTPNAGESPERRSIRGPVLCVVGAVVGFVMLLLLLFLVSGSWPLAVDRGSEHDSKSKTRGSAAGRAAGPVRGAADL